MSAFVDAKLSARICQSVHDYEWFGQNGARRTGGRENPCRECSAAAAVVLDWLTGAIVRPEVVRAFKSGWLTADRTGPTATSHGLAAVARYLVRAER